MNSWEMETIARLTFKAPETKHNSNNYENNQQDALYRLTF